MNQGFTIPERSSADGRDRIGDNRGLASHDQCTGSGFDDGITVTTRIKYRVGIVNLDAGQRRTTRKRATMDIGDRTGNENACQVCTILKSIRPNRVDGVRYERIHTANNQPIGLADDDSVTILA